MDKISIKSRADVIQLLKKFGIFIYSGDREGDDILMEEELRELYEMKMIKDKDFLQAISVLRTKD